MSGYARRGKKVSLFVHSDTYEENQVEESKKVFCEAGPAISNHCCPLSVRCLLPSLLIYFLLLSPHHCFPDTTPCVNNLRKEGPVPFSKDEPYWFCSGTFSRGQIFSLFPFRLFFGPLFLSPGGQREWNCPARSTHPMVNWANKGCSVRV